MSLAWDVGIGNGNANELQHTRDVLDVFLAELFVFRVEIVAFVRQSEAALPRGGDVIVDLSGSGLEPKAEENGNTFVMQPRDFGWQIPLALNRESG